MSQEKKIASLLAALLVGSSVCATEYTWTGASNDGKWATAGNWTVDGETATTTPSAATDVVSIPSGDDVTITMASGDRTGTLTISRNVTLTGTFTLDTIAAAEDSTAQLTLDTVSIANGTGCSISAPVKVLNTVDNTGNGTVAITGKLTGNGKITNSATNGSAWNGFKFTNCDASEFEGTYTGGTRASYGRDASAFTGEKSASPKASYHIGNSNGTSPIKSDNTTYTFGQFETSNFNLSSRKGVVLEIGALGTTSSISGSSFSNNSIKKVGNGLLKFAGTNLASMEIAAGSVEFTNGAQLPTAVTVIGNATVIVDEDSGAVLSQTSFTSTEGAAISVDSGAVVTTSNTLSGLTGGFTKSGAGVLEFSAAPAWTGDTVVSGGALIVPSGTTLTTSASSVTLEDGRVMYYASSAYVYTGADGVYATGSNWSTGSMPTDNTSVVIIPKASSLTMADNATTGYMILLADTTITGNITLVQVAGSGKLTLNNVNINVAAGSFKVNDLCVLGSVVNNTDLKFVVSGAFTGTGTVTQKANNQPSFYFYGETTEFAGTYCGESRSGYIRDTTAFYGDARGSAKASWWLGSYGSSYYNFQVSNTTYYFGQLTDPVFNARPGTGITIEVGALDNKESSVSGSLYDDSNVLRKVGTNSTFKVTLSDTKGKVEVQAGTMQLLGSNKPSAGISLTGDGATLVTPTDMGVTADGITIGVTGAVIDTSSDETAATTTFVLTTPYAAPTAEVTAIDGVNRTITISGEGDIYYATSDAVDAEWTKATGTTISVAASTVYLKSGKTSSAGTVAYSTVTTLDTLGGGSAITLNAPVIKRISPNKIYVKASQSDKALAPTTVFKYTIGDDDEVVLEAADKAVIAIPDAKNTKVTVSSTAAGYTSAATEYTIGGLDMTYYATASSMTYVNKSAATSRANMSTVSYDDVPENTATMWFGTTGAVDTDYIYYTYYIVNNQTRYTCGTYDSAGFPALSVNNSTGHIVLRGLKAGQYINVLTDSNLTTTNLTKAAALTDADHCDYYYTADAAGYATLAFTSSNKIFAIRVLEKLSVIDPGSATEAEVSGSESDKESDIVAKVAVDVPSAATSYVTASAYQAYFTKSAAWDSTAAEGAGAWTVTVALASDVIADAGTSALETAMAASVEGDANENFTLSDVAVKPGLYYGMSITATAGDSSLKATTLATGSTMDFTLSKPEITGSVYFINVKVSAAADE